jgi:hypothetical protein
MYIYFFRYQFSPEVTNQQKFQLQLLAVATANSMGFKDFWFGFEAAAPDQFGNYCGVIPDVSPDFEGLTANPNFAARTAWAKPPLAEFTSFIFSNFFGSEPEEQLRVV